MGDPVAVAQVIVCEARLSDLRKTYLALNPRSKAAREVRKALDHAERAYESALFVAHCR